MSSVERTIVEMAGLKDARTAIAGCGDIRTWIRLRIHTRRTIRQA